MRHCEKFHTEGIRQAYCAGNIFELKKQSLFIFVYQNWTLTWRVSLVKVNIKLTCEWKDKSLHFTSLKRRCSTGRTRRRQLERRTRTENQNIPIQDWTIFKLSHEFWTALVYFVVGISLRSLFHLASFSSRGSWLPEFQQILQWLHRAIRVLLVFFYWKMYQLSWLDENRSSRLP